MPSHRRASTCTAVLSVLLVLVVMTCTNGAVVAAEDTVTTTGYIDYFIGDLFVENPGSMMNGDNTEKAPPRFRPWRIIDVPDDSVLAFGCAGDAPTLRVVPGSADRVDVNSDAAMLPPTDNTCGSGGGTTQAGTPTQYKFSRLGGGNVTTVYSALFWGKRPSTVEEEGEGAPPPLMPVPKFQLKTILKAVAAMMEASWRKERGDEAMPESVALSADMVVFYFDFNGHYPSWLVAMGREDVEFRQPWERLHGEIKTVNLGTVV